MTSVRSNLPAYADLAAAEATLKANIGLLRHCGAEPSAIQIAAVAAVENVIVTATKQQVGWAKLRLIALRVLGIFLLQTPRLKRGRPKKGQHGLLPSLADFGIKDNHIATRALNVAKISEELFNAYLTTDEPTEGGLLKLAATGQVSREIIGGFLRHHPNGEATSDNEERYTPERVFNALGCRFDLDVASPGADIVPWVPADRHFTLADNGLQRDWGDTYVWMNAPHGRGTLPQWLEKFRQHANGIALVVDRTSAGWWQDLCCNADLILQVNKKINFLRPDDEPGTNASGSTLVAYGERAVQALVNAAAAGLGTLFKPCQSVPTSSHPPGPRDEDVDAYMTDPSVGEHVVAVMRTKIAEQEIPADDLWWVECCAGSGNILQHMPPDRQLGLDINPLASGILRADFFRYELDPTVRWVALTNPSFYDDGPTRIFNRAAVQNVRLIGLVLPAHLRTDKAQWVNGLDPFYECIHDELLPKDSFLRNGKPHDVPARFQIWVRRETCRQPLKERTEHSDLIWVPKSRSNEATIWICRRGPDIGDIIEAIGTTTPPEEYYGIRCSADAVMILRSIRWRDVLAPLPINHAPNMSQADIVRLYEAAETAQPDDVDDDEKSTRRALTTKGVAEPHSSWEPIGPFLRYGLDVVPDQPASSVIPSTSPQCGEARRSTDVGILSDEWVSWWAERVEQFKRDLRPHGPLLANIKEAVVDDQRSTYVLELRLAMRPTQTGPHNILFIRGCSTDERA